MSRASFANAGSSTRRSTSARVCNTPSCRVRAISARAFAVAMASSSRIESAHEIAGDGARQRVEHGRVQQRQRPAGVAQARAICNDCTDAGSAEGDAGQPPATGPPAMPALRMPVKGHAEPRDWRVVNKVLFSATTPSSKAARANSQFDQDDASVEEQRRSGVQERRCPGAHGQRRRGSCEGDRGPCEVVPIQGEHGHEPHPSRPAEYVARPCSTARSTAVERRTTVPLRRALR